MGDDNRNLHQEDPVSSEDVLDGSGSANDSGRTVTQDDLPQHLREYHPEPAVVAHTKHFKNQCSLWDCIRRSSLARELYCCVLHIIAAREDSRVQRPIMLPLERDIGFFENTFCVKVLERLESSINPGIPNIAANLLETHPWNQPANFGLNFFKREKVRWYSFINPYEIEKNKDAVWTMVKSVNLLNIERAIFKPKVSSDKAEDDDEDEDRAKQWRLYRYSIIKERSIRKGLYLMHYKPNPDKISVITDESERLVSSGLPRPITLSNDNYYKIFNFETLVVLILFYKPGCSMCNKIAKTFEKLAAVFHNDDRVVIASTDISDISDRFGVTKYPTLKFCPNANPLDPINVNWFNGLNDLISFINDRIGLNRDVEELHNPEPVPLLLGDSGQHPEPASIALANFPDSMCSLWDCRRRVSRLNDLYCRVHDELVAEQDQRLQSPILIPDISDVLYLREIALLQNCCFSRGKKKSGSSSHHYKPLAKESLGSTG